MRIIQSLRERRLGRSHHRTVAIANVTGHLLHAPLRLDLLRFRHAVAQPSRGAGLRGAEIPLSLPKIVLQLADFRGQLLLVLGDLLGGGRHAAILLLRSNGLLRPILLRLVV